MRAHILASFIFLPPSLFSRTGIFRLLPCPEYTRVIYTKCTSTQIMIPKKSGMQRTALVFVIPERQTGDALLGPGKVTTEEEGHFFLFKSPDTTSQRNPYNASFALGKTNNACLVHGNPMCPVSALQRCGCEEVVGHGITRAAVCFMLVNCTFKRGTSV